MKSAFLALSVIFASVSYGQNMTKNDVYKEFNLSFKDHRGFQFVATNDACEESFQSYKDAIEFAFTTSKRRDMMYVCIEVSNPTFLNHTYNLEELVELYLNISAKTKLND